MRKKEYFPYSAANNEEMHVKIKIKLIGNANCVVDFFSMVFNCISINAGTLFLIRSVMTLAFFFNQGSNNIISSKSCRMNAIGNNHISLYVSKAILFFVPVGID